MAFLRTSSTHKLKAGSFPPHGQNVGLAQDPRLAAAEPVRRRGSRKDGVDFAEPRCWHRGRCSGGKGRSLTNGSSPVGTRPSALGCGKGRPALASRSSPSLYAVAPPGQPREASNVRAGDVEAAPVGARRRPRRGRFAPDTSRRPERCEGPAKRERRLSHRPVGRGRPFPYTWFGLPALMSRTSGVEAQRS
ncbi:MAG: hypothetical protein JWM85_3161 [Acidimicrobiaceae bacterium]|nr:hypothetical protein [Acidimicrobiaceae bacterium]